MILEASQPISTAPPPPPSFSLPTAARPEPREAVRAHLDSVLPRGEFARERLSRATVLVVDDEPGNVRLLTRLLERAGCEDVIGTNQAPDAVRLYTERRPDLMLLDLHMPGMDGLAVLDQVRHARDDRSRSPVLVLTGDDTSEARESALHRGANEFVSKPFNVSEVLLRIDHLLETAVLHRELADRNRVLEQAVAARTAALEQDIARRERVERELRTSEARYRHLVENASDMIVQADGKGVIRYANEAAGRLFGLEPQAMEGRSFLGLIRPDARHAAGDVFIEQVRRRQPSSYQELPAVTPDGRDVWIELDVRLTWEGDELVAAQAVGRDVTERRQLEHLKDEFISVASHELRTPLTSIRAALGLLESGLMETQPERARHLLRIATRNGERLARLLNDILDLERMSSGSVRVERRPYDVAEVMTQAAETVRSAAEAANVLIVVDAPRATVSMDADRMCQVLVNLLGNAIKFSPAGGAVWLSAAAQEDGDVLFAVRDKGRGIPADRLEAVFERFTQVDVSDAREKGGSGLGLAICRAIVDQHGGRIWAESTLGAGSTFSVRLPA
ncbi:ATP-binding protein [Longimicrobium sp.]|uniref:ATP-binding response regulator n=1 Tax=Longimicrobium sp. TaxID=2029185 RepID=UPI002E320470|nr:ATP-binding protein [Longimicrobium sp.]HEX6042501.1 ATP-binding protein [Longimicrobium sp.]